MDGQGLSAGAKLTPVTVLVVDDHPALRAGLRSLIDSDPALRVLAEVESGEAAYAAYRKHRPDTVVMDLSMEGFGGIEAIRRIRSFDPQAAVLVYSVHDSQAVALAVQKELESRSENGDRLVAESLEVELNQALRAQAAAQKHYDKQRQSEAALNDQQRANILALTRDFPHLWNDPHTPDREWPGC